MKKYYVIGNNSSKSLSPTIFNHWFKKYKINAKYEYLEADNKTFHQKIKEVLKNKQTKGLNITIPFKQKIIKHTDILDTHSKKINAVNCVSVAKKIKAINTDWIGYYKTLPKIKKLNQKEILIIGYGGAALAIHYVLKKKGFKKITIVNRTKKKLSFEKKRTYTKDILKIEKYLKTSDLIINTIPKNPIIRRNLKMVRKQTILSDIVYMPKETSFLKAFPHNKKIYGISMLVQQAIPCFKMWFGFSPIVDNQLLKTLEKKIK